MPGVAAGGAAHGAAGGADRTIGHQIAFGAIGAGEDHRACVDKHVGPASATALDALSASCHQAGAQGVGPGPVSSVVRFENVGLRYGTGAEVLRDLSFTLDRGSCQVLLGPSGAGKTSLLKLIYLAQRPTRGFISTFGEEVTTLPRDAL